MPPGNIEEASEGVKEIVESLLARAEVGEEENETPVGVRLARRADATPPTRGGVDRGLLLPPVGRVKSRRASCLDSRRAILFRTEGTTTVEPRRTF